MMVGRYDDSHLLLVLQTDHSRIAGLIAAHWGNEVFARPKPYVSMVIAAQEHDSGWWDWEIKPTLNPGGHPLDYIGSAKSLGTRWLDFYRHGIQRVAEQDLYAAYNVSMHGDGLLTRGMGLLPYMPDHTGDHNIQAFLEEQKIWREEVVQELRRRPEYAEVATDAYLWRNFKYMEVFDQFAQFICNRYPLNSTERKNGPTKTLSDVPVPVSDGVEDVTLTIDVQDEFRAIVRPYPFGVAPLKISFQGRLVPDKVFRDEQEYLEHFYKGERVTVTYSLEPAA
jgi:hypothetical protein